MVRFGNFMCFPRCLDLKDLIYFQDLYQKFLDGDVAVASIPREEDPFWEPPEDMLVGTANVFLQSLAYALDFDDKLSVTDYKVLENVKITLKCHSLNPHLP